MPPHIEQAKTLVLGMDIGDQRAKLRRQPRADRPVVQECARRAAAADRPAEDKRLCRIILDATFGRERARRMAFWRIERSNDLGKVRARTDEVLPAASAQGKRQRAHQDRLAGPGFPGQRGESRLRFEVETSHQYEIANAQRRQHDPAISRPEQKGNIQSAESPHAPLPANNRMRIRALGERSRDGFSG